MRYRAGDWEYELVEGWGALPDGWEWGEVAGVAVDRDDNVHTFSRDLRHPYMVFDRSGRLIDHWGDGIFGDAHSLSLAPDGSLFFVEHSNSVILKFDAGGRHRMTMGTRGQGSDTGFTVELREPEGVPMSQSVPSGNGVDHAGPPFNWPTAVCVDDDGTIFVTDGYRNSRVHKFDADGRLLRSWGEPGHARDLRDTTDGPGRFHTPHGIQVHDGRLYVLDRENNRVQIFTTDGEFVAIWADFLRPSGIHIDRAAGLIFIAELKDRISIVDLEGRLVGRFGSERSREPGRFWCPHGIAVDSEGSLYVGQVLGGAHLHKFARVA